MSNILIRIENVLEFRDVISGNKSFGPPYENAKAFVLSIASIDMSPVYFSFIHSESEIRQWFSRNELPEGKIVSFASCEQDGKQAMARKSLSRYQCAAGIGSTSEDNRLHLDLDCISCIINPNDSDSWKETVKSLQRMVQKGNMLIHPIGHIECDFQNKFGVPRQNGMIPALEGKIVLEPKYRSLDAFRKLDLFSHIWLIWQFSQSMNNNSCHLTVRPPRMGGNIRVGVFASRAPYRPNHLALSCVKLEEIVRERSTVSFLRVSGIDMINKTPVYDIKPYIPYSDCKPEAADGYTSYTHEHCLEVLIPEELRRKVSQDLCEKLKRILILDPRPGYIGFGDRLFHMDYAGHTITFFAQNGQIIVTAIEPVSIQNDD